MNGITYADKWALNSEKYYDDKVYSWMESFVRSSKNILEIGCGVGYSTLALVQAGHNVLVIERGEDCVNKTKVLLESNNYSVQLILTNEDEITGFEEYDVIIIGADISSYDYCSLRYLGEICLRSLEIDTIIIWLLGFFTNEGEHTNEARLEIQRKVFFLAETLDEQQLKCLHFVERTTKNLFQDTYKDFESLLNKDDIFNISDAAFLKYDYDVANGIPTNVKVKNNNDDKRFISVVYYGNSYIDK